MKGQNEYLWISKIMTNTDILERCNEDKIAEYIKNPSMDKLKEIICEVYGEDNRAIFENRPNMTINRIKNLYIFDPRVKDVFGIDFVNDMITYDIGASYMVAELILNPNKMDCFKKFERIIGNDLYKDDTQGICRKLQAFFRYESLIIQLDENTITTVELHNLKEVFLDRYYDEYHEKIADSIPIKTPQDLRLYVERKSKMYDEAISKCTSIEKMKVLVFKKLFGMDYSRKNSSIYDKEDLTIEQLIYLYNTETFIKDERTINSGLFTQDELDAIELISIIDKVNDVEVLRKLYNELEKSSLEILNTLDFKNIREKIPFLYSKEFVDSLLTLEKAEEMVKNGEQGISIEITEEGIKIVKLFGANFRAFMHSTELNNSGISLPKGMSIEEIWKTFEEGMSTISGCPIEGDVLQSCNNIYGINIVFYSLDPSQIVGMGSKDIHVSHKKRMLNTKFNFHNLVRFDYPDELVRKVAAQVNNTAGEEIDFTHKYGEVTSKRQDQKVERGSRIYKDRRIMPDCIIVYGADKGKKYTQLAKAFAKNGKPITIFEIDVRAYGDKSYERAHKKENHKVEKEDSELIKKIKEIADNKERE